MPKVKRTTTEVQEIEAPQKECPPTLVDVDLWDYLETLKDEDFVQGSLTKRKFYVSQIEPPVTKAEGEPGYARIFSSRFGPDDIKALNPQAIRWRIIEKVMGLPGTRRMWFIAMMPEKNPPPGGAPSAVASNSEMGQALKTVVDLASDRTGVQREAMQQSMEVMSEAYKKGIEMMPKPGSIAEELKGLKDAGLLTIGNQGGFGLAEFKTLLEWGLPKLKELGLLGATPKEADPKKEFERVVDLIDVIETRFGKAAKGEASVWPMVIQTFGPPVVKMFDNITANVANILRARAALAGTPLPPAPAPAPVTQAIQTSGAATAAAPAAETPTMSPQDYIKMRFVVLCKEELENESPDAENIANWLEMTAPQLAELLSKTPEDGVMNFLQVDAIMQGIGNDEKAMGLKKAIYAELVKDAKETIA